MRERESAGAVLCACFAAMADLRQRVVSIVIRIYKWYEECQVKIRKSVSVDGKISEICSFRVQNKIKMVQSSQLLLDVLSASVEALTLALNHSYPLQML